MNQDSAPLSRLLSQKKRAEWLLLTCAVFAFSWVPTALILIFGDAALHPVFRTLFQLWPLAVVPLFGFVLCWFWRARLTRQLGELGFSDVEKSEGQGV